MKATCVYCGRDKESMDHVPPKLLLERQEPGFPPNLLTVPACRDCNNGFSDDEEYFRTILAHVAVTQSLSSKVESGGVVDRALREHSPGQDQDLLDSILVSEERVPMLEPDLVRLRRIVRKIAAGLTYLDYSRRVHPDQVSAVGLVHLPTDDPRTTILRLATHTERFQLKTWQDIQENVFSYIFVRNAYTSHRLTCIMEFHREFWGYARIPVAARQVGPPSDATRSQLRLFSGHDEGEATTDQGGANS